MMYQLLREVLFRLDAEAAHELAVAHIERLQSIPIKATRCMYCTAEVPPVAQPTPAS